jgi:hypothetical protein
MKDKSSGNDYPDDNDPFPQPFNRIEKKADDSYR